ncbi:hypothetical protein FNL55_15775 [Tardiphaga sp. vice352]|uniref:hypothetical protein n=1 Tax=Tardiphaga sp. vice352 TaxID=2592816 RepID=UPI00116387FD|nr:hypothetical protein [Tardiphaga sp. vice352]QDM32646.1 hypothetical protein FNL55_15775 [Tardiphaga sp. vice352]
MGILDALFGGNSPIGPAAQPSQASGPGFGDHLISGLQSFANSGGLGSAIINGGIGLATGQRADPGGRTQAAFSQIMSGPGDQQTKIAQLTNAFIASGDIDSAKKLYDLANGGITDKIKNFNFGQQNPAFAESLKKEDAPKYSMNPVFGTDEAGNPAMVQLSNHGGSQPVPLPKGFAIAKNPLQINTGTGTSLVDPITRQEIRNVPKDVGGVVEQEAEGKGRADAKSALPQIVDASNLMMKTIDQIDNHPGKGWSLGKYAMLPTIPGTEQANFRTQLGQLQGQTFMQAYQTLRGGGAITDIEGAKGTASIARLNDAQTPDAFNSALKDLKEVINTGMLRAHGKARASAGVQSPATAATPDPLGIR